MLTSTIQSLVDLMPSILAIQAANIKQEATVDPERAAGKILDSVVAGDLWVEFICALAKFPTLKDCVEIFGGIPQPEPESSLPLPELKASEEPVNSMPPIPTSSLKIPDSTPIVFPETTKDFEIKSVPRKEEPFPQIVQMATYVFPDPNAFRTAQSQPSWPSTSAGTMTQAKHQLYQNIMLEKKESIINAIMNGGFFYSMIYHMPNTLGRDNATCSTIKAQAVRYPYVAADIICDWVVKNKAWEEFIDALSKSGLGNVAKLFTSAS